MLKSNETCLRCKLTTITLKNATIDEKYILRKISKNFMQKKAF